MKKLEFETSKGNFILQDSPKELVEFTFTEATRLTIDGIAYQPLGLVKYMTEEHFAEVVSYEINKEAFTHRYLERDYKNYDSGVAYFETAKESFTSLICSLGWYLWENPNPTPKTTTIPDAYFDIDEVNDWQEAESKTLYNPILLKKI